MFFSQRYAENIFSGFEIIFIFDDSTYLNLKQHNFTKEKNMQIFAVNIHFI